MSPSRWLLLLSCAVAWSCGADPFGDSPNEELPRTVPSCDQACQDDIVGYALDNTLWLIWNENLAGHPSGSQSVLASCPLGGSAEINGSTGVASNGINTVNLTLELKACRNSGASYSLAFTGTVKWVGTFSSGHANAITFSSTSLGMEGDLTVYDKPTIAELCAVSLTDTYNKNATTPSTWLNGEICGRGTSQ